MFTAFTAQIQRIGTEPSGASTITDARRWHFASHCDIIGQTNVENSSRMDCLPRMKKDTKEVRSPACPEDGEFLPHAQILRSVTGKWKLEILWALAQKTLRFGELRRTIPGITQHMLTAQLRELQADGLVKRSAYAEIPPRVEYAVTAAALSLEPVFHAMMIWARKYAQQLEESPRKRTRSRPAMTPAGRAPKP